MASSSRYLGRDPLPEEEALEAIYRDIIGNLMICPDHRPEGVLSVPHSSFVSLMNPQLMKSEHMISLVRDRLDQQLSGKDEANTNIRQKLIKLFCIKTAKKRSLDHVDIWAFLDSVLDESFEELETHVVFRGSEANALLVPTIAKRSPNLKKLKLDFKFECTQSSPKLMPLMRSLDSLHLLTSLTLYHLEGYFDDNPILTLIGKNCPSLTHLRLAKSSSTSKHDILAIILGELVDYLIGPHEFFNEQPYRRFKRWTGPKIPLSFTCASRPNSLLLYASPFVIWSSSSTSIITTRRLLNQRLRLLFSVTCPFLRSSSPVRVL